MFVRYMSFTQIFYSHTVVFRCCLIEKKKKKIFNGRIHASSHRAQLISQLTKNVRLCLSYIARKLICEFNRTFNRPSFLSSRRLLLSFSHTLEVTPLPSPESSLLRNSRSPVAISCVVDFILKAGFLV